MYIVGRLKVCFWRYIKGMLKMYEMVFQRYIKNIFMDSKDHIYILHGYFWYITINTKVYPLHLLPFSTHLCILNVLGKQPENQCLYCRDGNLLTWRMGMLLCSGGRRGLGIYIYARHASRHLKKKSLNDGDMHFMIRKKKSFMVRRYAFHD
jgi:hypothetical protein